MNHLAFSVIQRMLSIWSLVPLPFLFFLCLFYTHFLLQGSSQPRDWTCVSCVSCIAGGLFTSWAVGEAVHAWSSAFSKSSLDISKFSVHILGSKPSLKDFELYLVSLWNKHNCPEVWTFFGIAFGIGMKTDLFQSCGHCWVFQICLHIECSTLTASSFRIWNSSAGIPSPPLALFVVMLPKAHLTSCSRISGSRWMTTSWWLSRSLRAFLYSSVYSWHLFLASLLLLGPYFFCLLSCQSLHEMSPGISNFLEEICSLSHSTVFLYFFALFIEDLFISPILWNSAFSWIYLSLSSLPFTSLLCLAICKTSSDNHFAFLHFSLGWILCSPLLQCYKPSSIVLIPWILFVTSTVWS